MAAIALDSGAVRVDRTVIALLILGIGLGTMAIADFLPPWLWLIALGIAAWRWRLTGQGRPPPSTRVRTATGLGLGALLVSTGNIGLGLEAAIPLFIGFLWLKLLEVHSDRDLGMTTGLGSFLAGASVLLDQSLMQMLIALTAVILLWSAVFASRIPPGPRRLRSALGRCSSMMLQALPIAAILFILVPRPSVRLNVSQGQATSGISDHIKPGMVADLAINQSVAFRVTFPDDNMPATEQLYWRGIVLPVTDGIGWYRDNRRRGIGRPPQLARGDADPAIRQHIDLLPHGRTWLYALDPPLRMDQHATPRTGSELAHSQAVITALSYTVTSHPRREAADGDGVTIARASMLPERVDPQVAELAGLWLERGRERGGGVDAMIAVADAWFLEQSFVYSLQPGQMEGDPNADFLFSRKAGFCSHYATAVALLARLQGFPARVVLGYHGGEWNAPGRFLVVRNAHAHAWCEIFDQATGTWRRYDPTATIAGEHIERMASEGSAAGDPNTAASDMMRSFRNLRQWWDYLDASWQTTIYRFDTDLQISIAESVGLGDWGRVGLLISSLIGSVLALLAIALLIRRRPPAEDPAARLYRHWRQRLARLGCADDPSEGPLAYAERARRCLPERSASIDRVTQAYIAARYGKTSAEALPLLRRALRRTGENGPTP